MSTTVSTSNGGSPAVSASSTASTMTFSCGRKSVSIEVVPSSTSSEDIIKRWVIEKAEEDCFYSFDVGQLFAMHQLWNELFPNIKPYYAVKCNDEPLLLQILVNLGIGFDCGSKAEIKKVMDLGGSSSDIIFHNPCKPIPHLQYATSCGVNVMICDSENELYKLHNHCHSSKILIRLTVKNSEALIPLDRFGCSVSTACKLLQLAKDLNLNIVGVCFHVGGRTNSTEPYKKALKRAHEVFEFGGSIGMKMNLLDIGGGFLGEKRDHPKIQELSHAISASIHDIFFDFPDITVIAEPGRFFASSAFTLAANVYGKKKPDPETTDGKEKFIYVIADGYYGSFQDDVEVPFPNIIRKEEKEEEGTKYLSVIWGPTCSPHDTVCTMDLPELYTGDWIYFEDMGAYTLICHSGVNGFGKPNVYPFIKEEDCKFLEGLQCL